MLRDDVEFVAFDLETTGLSPSFHRIVEIGAVRFRADGTELARMEQLINPRCRIPRVATRVHGITDAMVRGEPTIEEALPSFLRFLGSEETVLLAHNASFDIGFISAALSRCREQIPDHDILDTLELARLRLPRLHNHRLETIADHLRIRFSAKHRALGDALVVAAAFRKLLAQRPAIRTLDEVFGLLSALFFESMALSKLSVPAGYEPLAEAIQSCRAISIVYGGGTRGHSTRQITPTALRESRGTVYVIAHCHLDDMEKHFRLDRILKIEI